MNPSTAGWVSACLRCARRSSLGEHPTGCADCARDGVGAPMLPAPGERPAADRRRIGNGGTMWDWASLLPPHGANAPVSLGEGGTPLIELAWTGAPCRVLVKDERANPTGSFKDRLCSAAITRARSVGAELVAVASSGNAGLSTAAYAAAAGMRCVVLSTPGLPEPTSAALRALGACVLLTETPEDRWVALRTGVAELGWYALTNYVWPPVSSNVFGVHAYRTIAFELARSLDWQAPDWVIMPVSRGDGLYGVWSGFVELAELGWAASVPRMLAVERFPSLSQALERGWEQPDRVESTEPVAARSIGDRQATFMALATVRRSDGLAVGCGDDELWSAWRRLAAHGWLYELSSASVLCGLDALVGQGLLDGSSTVVLVGTATAFPQATLGAAQVGVPVADPRDPVELARAAPPPARASRPTQR